MKYWRGYLVAGIIAACTIALRKFAEAHTALVDMFYPYVTRMMQSFLAEWSGAVDFCLWQVLLIALGVLILASAVLMVILKWNPIQWFGWVLSAVSIVALLNMGVYGLNKYAGPLAEDIRLKEADYTATELQAAAEYYRDQANRLADTVARDPSGDPAFEGFETLSKQAGAGFEVLTKEYFNPVFAGSTAPVKKLGRSGYYTARKIGGYMAGITGEAAVNPEAPAVYLPFGMCEQMARRMCIAIDRDAEFAGILAACLNPDPAFQYAGYLTAYRYCEHALDVLAENTGDTSVLAVKNGANQNLIHDLQVFRDFFGDHYQDTQVAELLISWHIEKYVLPLQEEEEVLFDPLDETQVDLSGLVNAPKETEAQDE